MKTCTKCKESKELSEFHKQSRNKDGLESWCRSCCSFYKKNVRNARSNAEKEQHKTKESNRKKISYSTRSNTTKNKYNVKRRITRNSEANKERSRKHDNDKYNNNELYKLKKILRSRLYCALKNDQKSGSAVSDLGCTIEEFKQHLESQFEDWMTWDNHGPYDKDRRTWQIDHIDALANFDLSNREEFLKVVHYSNMQPLLALDNILKSNKKTDIIEESLK